jgi:hypothetical protein
MRVEVDGRKEANNGLVLYFRRRPGHLAWGYPDRVDLLVVVAVKKRCRVKRILEIPERAIYGASAQFSQRVYGRQMHDGGGARLTGHAAAGD